MPEYMGGQMHKLTVFLDVMPFYKLHEPILLGLNFLDEQDPYPPSSGFPWSEHVKPRARYIHIHLDIEAD